MSSAQQLYTTAWSYEAADKYGGRCDIVPLPSNLSGVQSAGLADFEEARASSSSTASYAKLHTLEDGTRAILRVVEPGNALQYQVFSSSSTNSSSEANTIFLLPDSHTARIVPEVSVSLLANDSGGTQIQILFLAELGVGLVAYRLLLSEEDLRDPSNLPGDSRGSARWCTEQQILPAHVVSKSSPVLVHVLDKRRLSRDTFALALSDGTLLKVEWVPEEGRFRDTALSRQQSFLSGMRSFLPGRFGSSPNLAAIAAGPSTSTSKTSTAIQSPDQVVHMTSLRSASLYTISRDRKLRVWSANNNNCLETIQLPHTPTTMEIVPVSSSSNSPEVEQDPSSVSLLSPEPAVLARLFDGEGSSQYLLVYIPTYHVQASFFVLYHLEFDAKDQIRSVVSILEKPCDFALDASSSTTSLKDFIVARNKFGVQLWTLWSENGQSVTRFSIMSLVPLAEASILPEGSSWSIVELSPHQQSHSLDGPSALFDETYAALREEIDATNLSAPELAHQVTLCAKQAALEAFLSHLFAPGRYPISSIAAALYVYLQQLLRKSSQHNQSLSVPVRASEGVSLAQQILDTVGSFVRLEEDPQTGAPREANYIKAYKLEFLKLLALSEEYKRNAKAPLSISVSGQDELLVLAKCAVASLAPDAWPYVPKHILNADDQAPYDSSLNGHIGALRALAAQASDYLREAGALERFDIAAVQAVTSPSTLSLDDVAASLYEETVQPYLSEACSDQLSTKLRQVAEAWIATGSHQASSSTGPRNVSSLFDLAISSLPALVQRAELDAGTAIKGSSPSATLDLVVEEASVSLAKRRKHSINLFLLSLCLINGALDLETSGEDDAAAGQEDGSEDSPPYVSEDHKVDVLARSWEVFQGLSFGTWLAGHNSALTDVHLDLTDADEEPLSEAMRTLHFARLQTNSANGSSTSTLCASLLSNLLHTADGINMDAQDNGSSIARAADAFLEASRLVDFDNLSTLGVSHTVSILLAGNMDADASALLARVPETEEDAALLHQSALIACRNGDAQTALSYFDKVASAIYTDDASLAVLSQTIDADACDSRSAYYKYVVGLLDDGKTYTAVAKAALQALLALEEEDAGPVPGDQMPAWAKDLWYKAFHNFTLAGDFDTAYSTLMRMPTKALKLDGMRHLVAVMCDNGSADILLRYGFVGLQVEFEQCLSFRARNANPLAIPDYYRILYSWQCLLNDYRGAAATMYQKAKRLANLGVDGSHAVEVLTVQCQTYLVAINTLDLVHPAKQWILVGNEGQKPAPVPKKLRLLDPQMQDPAHVTLQAIKVEYTLALSRLQLIRDFPELISGGQVLDAHGAVALFSQIGAFDQALQAASSLRLDMSNVFEHLAMRCVAFDREDLAGGRDESWILRDYNASTWGGSLAAKGWKLLQLYLERYDIGGQHRRTVLRTILEEDRRTRLPKFLVDWFLISQPEHLIWKLTEFDLLEDAFVYAGRMLEQRFAQLRKDTSATASARIYIPYNLLDQLLLLDLTGESSQRKLDIEDRQKVLRDTLISDRRQADQILAIL